jgi:hypothetical protein
MDWKRHDYNIRSKVEEWFSVIGPELQDPAIDPANVYNMDETGVMLSAPNSLKVLVGKDDYSGSRGVRVKRTVITAIECISADGRSLHPLIIWPAATQRAPGQLTPLLDGILLAPNLDTLIVRLVCTGFSMSSILRLKLRLGTSHVFSSVMGLAPMSPLKLWNFAIRIT